MIDLEVGAARITQYANAVVALVTDQGTEHLISDTGPIATHTIRMDDMEALGHSLPTVPSVHDGPAVCEDDALAVGRSRRDDIETIDSSDEDGAVIAARGGNNNQPSASSNADPNTIAAVGGSNLSTPSNQDPGADPKTIPRMFHGFISWRAFVDKTPQTHVFCVNIDLTFCFLGYGMDWSLGLRTEAGTHAPQLFWL